MSKDRIKVGLIGFGRMGGFYLDAMQKSDDWDIVYICDIDPEARALAAAKSPESEIVDNEDVIFQDPEIQAVGLYTLANFRQEQVEKAVKYGKHVISEKPIADSIEHEWEVVKMMEKTDLISAVNLYLRNSWYHNELKKFVESGEIGELAILRVCHMTPGLAPGEGHEYEGPSFHDCGMHYVDIARWYAGCEYYTWRAQAIRMWSYPDPWWLQCQGTFENGVVFDITQGFVYGQLAKNQTHNSYIDIIGTKGIARMTHDFKTAVVDLRGVTRTELIERPFGGKNIDVLCKLFAESIRKGEADPRLPSMRDSAMASQYAWDFLTNARANGMPSIGDIETLEAIRERRRHMKDGYGLLRHHRH